MRLCLIISHMWAARRIGRHEIHRRLVGSVDRAALCAKGTSAHVRGPTNWTWNIHIHSRVHIATTTSEQCASVGNVWVRACTTSIDKNKQTTWRSYSLAAATHIHASFIYRTHEPYTHVCTRTPSNTRCARCHQQLHEAECSYAAACGRRQRWQHSFRRQRRRSQRLLLFWWFWPPLSRCRVRWPTA